ncbi:MULTISPECIES: hypothetical protein [unclassified Streptomyces]|uniref:hypothetical protein n=1 Tax=unclassified Streptomyces TaxID=2593676 RepID=UPI0004BD21CC|nr:MULTISPECIES: hypothetical protein [unclassified Streptomyces]
MSPLPDDQARTELRRQVAQAAERRELERNRIETEFWQQIDRLQNSYHGAQQDIADELGIKRNQILRQTKRYRSAQDPAHD